MNYTKGLCVDKLELIRGMIAYNELKPEELEWIWWKLNDVSHEIDEYIDKNQIRERK